VCSIFYLRFYDVIFFYILLYSIFYSIFYSILFYFYSITSYSIILYKPIFSNLLRVAAALLGLQWLKLAARLAAGMVETSCPGKLSRPFQPSHPVQESIPPSPGSHPRKGGKGGSRVGRSKLKCVWGCVWLCVGVYVCGLCFLGKPV
jgi:hypothetical protein